MSRRSVLKTLGVTAGLAASGTRFGVVLLGVLFICLVGCRKEADSSSGSSLDANVKRYHLRGTILGKSAVTDEVTIKHGDIVGLMPAMTMVYKVKDPAVIEEVQPGDQVAADLLVHSSSGDYLLDDVVITGESRRNRLPPALPPHQLLVGEQVPDVPLVNQDGKTIHLGDYRRKTVLVTFIYTRCPMPTACPLITSHFAKVNEQLATDPQAYARSHLISITLDPDYDKPPVLRQYGLAYLDDKATEFSHWEFADTTPADLKKLAAAFGLEYTAEDNQITHTMQTTLIGPDNKVAQIWEGSGWNPEEVANSVKAAISKAKR